MLKRNKATALRLWEEVCNSRNFDLQDGWLRWDTLGFMQQLGVIPVPEQTGG